MNLFDILFMAKTGTVKPDANLFDILFAKKLQAAAEKIVTIIGNPLSFLAKKAQTAKSTKISMTPVQDLHGYDNPWPAGGGVNQWDEEWEVGGYNTNTGVKQTDNTRIRCKNSIKCTPSTQYYFKSSYAGTIFYYDENNEFISSQGNNGNLTFTTPSNASTMTFQMSMSYGTTYNNDIAINYPATITTYAPYSNICPISGRSSVEIKCADGESVVHDTVTISFGETVYSGTLDVETGILTVDRAKFDLSQKTWVKSYTRFNTSTTITNAPSGNNAKCLCSKYKSNVGASTRTSDFSICFANNGYVYVYDTSFDGDETAFKESMANVDFVYELAQPTTIQLTPSQIQILKGQNTIWIEDEGAVMELTYRA